MLLIVPLPYTWKRKLFNFISENPLIAKLQYGMKVSFSQTIAENLSQQLQITFIFILILFIDSVNRVYRVQVELAATKAKGQKYGSRTLIHKALANCQAAPVCWVAPIVWKCKRANSIRSATCICVASRFSSP